MNSIFGKPLEDITFADVKEFGERQIKESLNIDYKKDDSSLEKIVKTLVSFANTTGGWVVIGIEDKDDKPKLPITGMSHSDNTERRITDAIISSVSPIILPQFKTVHSDDNKYTFVVLFVPMSSAGPHWMTYKKSTFVFKRIADRAAGQDWENYADGKEWEMLRNRRQKSAELSKKISEELDWCLRRVYLTTKLFQERVSNSVLRGGHSLRNEETEGALQFRALPRFPDTPMASLPELKQSFGNLTVNLSPSFRPNTFPDFQGQAVKTYQYGVYTSSEQDYPKGFYFSGIDKYGQFLQSIPIETYHTERELFFISIPSLVAAIVGGLRYTGNLYAEFSTDTELILSINYSGQLETLLFREIIDDRLWPWLVNNPPKTVTGSFEIERNALASQLRDDENVMELASDIIQEIFYSFGYGYYNPEGLKSLLDTILQKS